MRSQATGAPGDDPKTFPSPGIVQISEFIDFLSRFPGVSALEATCAVTLRAAINQEAHMKKIILAGVIALGAWGITLIPAPAQAGNCDNVRCMACPAGTVWSPVPNDCCRCVPV